VPAPTWRIWAGLQRVTCHRTRGWRSTPKPGGFPRWGGHG